MAFSPYVIREVDLFLGDEATSTNFNLQAQKVDLVPDTEQWQVKALAPAGVYAGVDNATWKMEIDYIFGADDTTPADAMANFLAANHGTQVTATYRPVSGGPGWTILVTLIAGGIGGDRGIATKSVSLPCEGQPLAVVAPV